MTTASLHPDINVRSLAHFPLENGATLGGVTVAYETWGTLNARGTNAVLICHALTGSAHAGGDNGWWENLIGPNKTFDTDTYFVICTNILGSCYGTTGPASINPETGKCWGSRFPAISVRDMVRLQHTLLELLGVRELVTVTGGSLGGMQALEWAIMYPEMVRSVIPIATAAEHSAWCIAFNEAARAAIMGDPGWQGGEYSDQPADGLALARMIAMISYRSRESFDMRHGRRLQPDNNDGARFSIEGYLHYQGAKLVGRFDANSYLTITRAMDDQDVGRGRGSVGEALGSIVSPALCIGIDSDILYPAGEQQAIARAIPHGRYEEIHSPHGHDAFLIEFSQLHSHITAFLKEVDNHDIA